MAIVRYPDPCLTQKAEPRAVDDGLRAIGKRLLHARDDTRARGLAAAHIGEAAPIIVVAAEPETGNSALVLYNPTVLAVSAETATGPEGSVSMPGIEVEVDRPIWAEVSWQDETGAGHRERFDGIKARIALHEIDQMNGVFFLTRISRLKREMALRKWKKQRLQGRGG